MHEQFLLTTDNENKLSQLSKVQLIKFITAQQEHIAELQIEKNNLKKKARLLPDEDAKLYSLREIIALMPGNIFWKDKTGKYLGCNNNVAKWLGFRSPDDIIGKSNKDFLPEDYAQKLDQTDQEVIDSKQGRFLEEAGLHLSNDQLVTFFAHKIPLLNSSNEVIGLLGIAMDITAQKKMEEELKLAKEKAEASNRAKSQFLAVINHELRTPLTCIIGLTDLLKENKLPSEERLQTLAAIENCSHYLLNLVKDVLDFSRLETGKHHVKLTTLSIATLIHEIYSLLKPLAEKKGLQLEIELCSSLPQFILTDQRILRHILINLINNAIKFTEKGYIKIIVNALEQKVKHVKLEIKVIDTGKGIPSDKLEVIFKPFQQLEDAYTRQSSRNGTGLGLSIVKKLAELLDIQIQVESQPQKGSIFSLIGEFAIQENAIQPVQKTSPFVQSPPKKASFKKTILESKSIKVLLIEDDPIIQFIHKKMLSELGCTVEVVAYGRDALQKVDQYHLIFVDISLPDMSGFDVIKALRSKPDTEHLPIIALTVFTGKQEKTTSLAAGANEFASKPISRSRLKKLLQKYV